MYLYCLTVSPTKLLISRFKTYLNIFFGTYQSITSWYSNWRIFNTSHSAQIVAHFRTMYPPNFSLMYRYGGVKVFKNRLRMYKVPIGPQFHVSQLVVDHNPLKKSFLLLKKNLHSMVYTVMHGIWIVQFPFPLFPELIPVVVVQMW